MRSLKSLRIALSLVLTLTATAAFAKNDALTLVPADAVSVGVVHLDQLRTSPLASTLLQHTDRMSADGDADKFLTDAGLDPTKDVDLLVVATSPVTRLGSDAEVLLIAEGRFNVDRLSKALAARGAVKKSASNVTYFVTPEEKGEKRGAVAFVHNGLSILGTEAAVVEALATRASGGSAFATASMLGQDAARIEPNATAWAVVDVGDPPPMARAFTRAGSLSIARARLGSSAERAPRSARAAWSEEICPVRSAVAAR